jgi:hypothetical protein
MAGSIVEEPVPDSETEDKMLQGLTFCRKDEGENEWATGSTAGSLDSNNLVCIEGDDCVDDELMQIPSYFIPDTLDPYFIHGNHYCVVCETYPIVGIRLHCQHFKPSQGWPGEGCCHHCFEELFKSGDRAKREQWLISFEPDELETDGPLQNKYREKFFAIDEHEQDEEQSDKENLFQIDTERDEYKRSSPLRIFSHKRNEKGNCENGENNKTADETFIESPKRKNTEIHAGEKQSFHILGTSTRDGLAYPQVLSPSLMESLLCFLPEQISCENFWLKYSLVRDGASLNTLQNYTRASSHTIIAIQTTSGDVFGSFTSSPWQIKKESFGNGESFVWKMWHNRTEAGNSIHENFAQQERKIQIFPNSILNYSVQICTNEIIGVGDAQIGEDIYPKNVEEEQASSFAFLLHSDLRRGTTGSSATFCSPRLTSTSEKDGTFDVLNLEVWAFTPCTKVDNAERLELKTYPRQNPRGLASHHSAFALRRPDRKLGDGECDKIMFNLEFLPEESDEGSGTSTSVLPTSGKKWKSDSIGPQDGDTLQPASKLDAP